MIFKYLLNCLCPKHIDEDELRTNMSSDSSIKTLPPPDFMPTNEYNYNTSYNTSYLWYQFNYNN